MSRFTSKTQAMNKRKHAWLCLKCNHEHRRKTKLCEICHSSELQYFPSRKELNRYHQLRMLLKFGAIEHLSLQPEFPIEINGHKICLYRADFQYWDKGQRIIEDCKGEETDVFKLKAKLVKACHGITVTVT